MDSQLARDCIQNIWQKGFILSSFYSFIINNPHLSFWQKTQIYSVCPSVKYCKSFDDWHTEHNRRISKGAKGIPYFDECNPSRRKYVFDISQTYGNAPVSLRKYKLTINQLRDVVGRQCDLNGMDSQTVNSVLYEYCRMQYGHSNESEFEEEYLACLTEGVSSCLYEMTGNQYESNVASLPFDYATNFKLCQEVVTISSDLLELIEEEVKRINYENSEPNRIEPLYGESASSRSFEKEEQKGSDIQQTLWDFTSQLSHGGIPDKVFGTTDERRATDYNEQRTSRSRKVEKNARQTTEQISFLEFDIYGESTALARARESNRRNNTPSSSLRSASNYELTSENFDYSAGAKTRFKNNIAAIRLMKEIENEQRQATSEEKAVLAKYVGWGGLPQAFDGLNDSWSKEHKELAELLSIEDYQSAKESVLNAHYTTNTVIDGVYAGLKRLGFVQGRILEPSMGIGNFIGLLPDTFSAKETYGVEIDSITGRIAKLLYPETHIEVKGFEETNYANNSFDGVVTNVPFGSYKVFDRHYNKLGFYIHNYFIAKSLDKVRAGGIVAVVTTKGTMDKEGTDVRQYLADRAELLGAIRLPNTAFKSNANTEVTSDILFLKKRSKIINSKDEWIHTSAFEVESENYEKNQIQLNNYFIRHPQMMLGRMAQQATLYGNSSETTLLPDNRHLREAILEAIQYLPESIYDPKKAIKIEEKVSNAIISIEGYEGVKNYCYEVIEGRPYQRIDDQLILQDISRSNVGRMCAMIELRKQVRQLLNVQIANCSDAELRAEQNCLNTLYDKFVRDYGLINGKTNKALFREDADFALLISIENVNQSTQTATKTDIFTKRTIQPHKTITSCENVTEALSISKNERGIVDIKFIEKLTGKSYNEVIEELDGLVYQNPADVLIGHDGPYKGWEISAEYLSGNVKEKLLIAKQAAQLNPKYQANVDALEAIQPIHLTASEISVRLGATWINEHYYKQFACELLKVSDYAEDYIKIRYEPLLGEWKVKREAYLRHDLNANKIYGTSRIDAYRLLEQALNQQTPSVYDIFDDGDGRTRRVLNRPETIAAREKLHKIQQAFKDWIFEEPKRRAYLVDKYNNAFNNTVLAKYDGSYLQFHGMNPFITLKDYQKDAVERILVSGNTLLHHVVGSGKTFEMAAAAMKMRQLGIAKKPCIVVPNHLVVQWANEFRMLYPNSNLLIASRKDFEKTNRKRFVARVATGDWDAIIIAASSFEKIPISQERQKAKIQSELDAIAECIESLKEERGDRSTIKSLVRAMMSKKAVLKKLTDDSKKDDLLIFEELGIDALFVDEAQRYKNKFIYTRMNNVAGISKAMSQRASDMDMKCEYINEINNGNRGVVFATGTPISNSMVEMFTLQSYLQRNELAEIGMTYFDAWAANFGETVTALELAPSGQGYRSRTRFAKFTNLPELLKMYRSFADVKTADMLNLPVPTAKKIVVTTKPSEEILILNEKIVERAKLIADGGVKPEQDNMLCVTHDGKMIALDPRCYDSKLQDSPSNKVNICVENVFRIWSDTAKNKSTQLIFCDMSTPKCSFSEYNPKNSFDVYNDIKSKLVAMGVPQDQVAFIHEADTDLQKQELFERVRQGDIRILIGSTEKCGAGTNVQQRLIALHHLDTPYRPSDLEQREGRIIRQGNSNSEVEIYTYVTERTFDSYSYQILENKQRFISQVNKGDYSVREASDIDETTLSYAEIKAITAANPKIKRKMEIEQELSRLRTLEFQYRQNKYVLQDRIAQLPKEIDRKAQQIANTKADIKLRNDNGTEAFRIRISNNVYAERKEGGDMLLAAIKSQKYEDKPIGEFCGFHIFPCPRKNLFDLQSVKLVGASSSYDVEVSESGVGTSTRLENFVNSLEEQLVKHEKRKTELENELAIAKIEVEKSFEYSDQLATYDAELTSINAELDLDKAETEIVIDDEQSQSDEDSAIAVISEIDNQDCYACME